MSAAGPSRLGMFGGVQFANPLQIQTYFSRAHAPQVVVLLHKGVDISAYNPIHAWRFRPAPVIAAFSRTAGLAPVVQGKEAIWHWFMAARPDARAVCLLYYARLLLCISYDHPASSCRPSFP